MNEIKVEKNIPVPAIKKGRPGICQMLRTMKKGESFLYPRIKQGGIGTAARNANVKVATRKVSENEIRVWRIA